jgi:hypothetical protein
MLVGVWATAIVAGFAMMHWGLESPLNAVPGIAPFSTYLYMSGTTFFTLGLGDVTPMGAPGRALVVVEAGVGFGFLAAIISYLPAILYQAFSSREVSISLLDARAGSPPTAGELLRRHGNDMREIAQLLYDWERWSAELLGTHLAYPVRAYFRSQHTNQSWLAGADRDPRYVCPDHCWRRRGPHTSGAADVCHGSSRGGRLGPDFCEIAAAGFGA